MKIQRENDERKKNSRINDLELIASSSGAVLTEKHSSSISTSEHTPPSMSGT